MTFPYPGTPPQPGYPQPPAQPQYPQAPVGYPQPPAQPQYPQAPVGYPQYGQPQGYPQQYGQPQPGPAQQPAEASLDGFFSQPSTGWGPSVTPTGKTPDNTVYLMVVAQHITKAHIEHATKFQSTELDYYRNNQPKFVMKVPVYVAPGTTVYTQQGQQVIDDGRAQYYVQGADKDLLASAMAQVGASAGPPELGAVIAVTKTGSRPTRSGTYSAVKTMQYWRPGPEAANFAQQSGIQYPDLNTPAPTADEVSAPTPAPAANGNGAAQVPGYQALAPNASQTAPQGPSLPPTNPAPQAMPQIPQPEIPQTAPAPAPQAPAAAGGLSPEQQALLAQLTGQPAPTG